MAVKLLDLKNRDKFSRPLDKNHQITYKVKRMRPASEFTKPRQQWSSIKKTQNSMK